MKIANKIFLSILLSNISFAAKSEKATIVLECDTQKLSGARQGSGGHINLGLLITPKTGVIIESDTFGADGMEYVSHNSVCKPTNNDIVTKIFNVKVAPEISKSDSNSSNDQEPTPIDPPSISLQKFLPLVELCDTKKTTYEKKSCKQNIPLGAQYVLEGTVYNIINERKFILKLSSDQYANILGDFSQSMDSLIDLSNSKRKFSFVGELTDLGTGIMVKHDFNYVRSIN